MATDSVYSTITTAQSNSLVRTGDGTLVAGAAGLVSQDGTDGIFIDNNGKLVSQANGGIWDTAETLTDGATVTWDWDKNLNIAQVTLAGSRTLAITNAKIGDKGLLKVIQDATGSRVITWPTTTVKPTTPLTTTASAIDFVVLECVAANVFWMTANLKGVS